jgi:hypothetical protein
LMAGSRGGGGWGIRDNLGVRVDDGLAEPCTKRLWTSTIASYVVVEISGLETTTKIKIY